MPIKADIHAAGTIEQILKRQVADKIVGEVFSGGGVGAVVAADRDFEAVVEERFRQLITIAISCGIGLLVAIVLIDAKRQVDALDGVCCPVVELRLQEAEERIA